MARRMICSRPWGMWELTERGGAGSSLTCISATETGVSAVKGSWPVAISYIMTPREYRSLRLSIFEPETCSGLI